MMDAREKMYGLSVLYAKKGQFMPQDLEEEMRNTAGIMEFLIRRPRIKVGQYLDGFEGWGDTEFSYDAEFGTITIDIDGYSICIARGEGGADNFKQASVNQDDVVVGAFKITVDNADAILEDDHEIYLDKTFPRKDS
jgi:hypothetical protein